MKPEDKVYRDYINVLKEELMPAMGCTEPISIAYAAARARDILGEMPDQVLVEVSDNIIKNVKSVVVPNTCNLKGIKAAAAAGIVVGNADKKLEVISFVDNDEKQEIKAFLKNNDITIRKIESDHIFDLMVRLSKGNSTVSVRISHFHTNITLIKKNDEIVFENQGCDEKALTTITDRSFMNVKEIITFAQTVDLSEIHDLLQAQIDYNTSIAKEGLKNDWGANIGSTLIDIWGNDIKIRAKAMAAAGSDARMSGCEKPVMIVSGSGNQGLTTSIPVIEYARELGADKETLYRALIISNLVTIHQKTGIGRLSAYCGAVSAGVGAGAGIAWLHKGGFKEIAHTIVNALAIVSGIICDGAKPSCAAKIASAVEAGILGFHMYQKGHQFYNGEGILIKGVDDNIKNIGRLARIGMKETDKEIIRMMLGE